jgi:hypothetical protein
MHRLVLVTISLALACTPTADEAERPQPPAASDSIAPVEAEPAVGDGNEFFLGYVGQTGIEHCPNGHEFEWLDVRSTLGFIPTGGRSLEPWLGKVVLARGEALPRPPASTKIEPAPCPIMQMRSDWTNSPQGIRVDRGDHPAIEYFMVTSAGPVDAFVVVQKGEELHVRFENTLSFALGRVGFVAHYEGCYGKPRSTQRGYDGKPLGSGEAIEASFPILDVVESARVHLIDSIELKVEKVADSPTLHVDVDAPLSAFGVDLACPDTK